MITLQGGNLSLQSYRVLKSVSLSAIIDCLHLPLCLLLMMLHLAANWEHTVILNPLMQISVTVCLIFVRFFDRKATFFKWLFVIFSPFLVPSRRFDIVGLFPR